MCRLPCSIRLRNLAERDELFSCSGICGTIISGHEEADVGFRRLTDSDARVEIGFRGGHLDGHTDYADGISPRVQEGTR